MATASSDVVRDLDAITSEIRKMRQEVKLTTQNVNSLNKDLKLDPTNVQIITKRFEEQKKILASYQKELDLQNQKMAKLNTARQQGSISEKEYMNSLQKTELEINKLNLAIEKQVKLTKDSVLQQQLLNAQTEQQKTNLDKTITATDKYAKALKYLIAIYTVAITKSIQLGAELYDLSKKYGTTAEQLQKQRFLYEELAEDSSGYENALKSLAGVIRTLNRGTGDVNAIAGALRKIGLSINDIKGETAAGAYNKIFEALRNLTDEQERENAALLIFGDNGLNVANVAGATTQQINALNTALENAGLITNDQAASLKELELQYNLVKQSLSSATAEIVVAFAPALISLAGIIKNLASFLSSDFGKALLTTLTIGTLIGAMINKTAKLLKSLIVLQTFDVVVKGKQSVATGVLTVKQIIFNKQLLKTVLLMAAVTGGVSLILAGLSALIGLLGTATSKTKTFDEEYKQLMTDMGQQFADTSVSTQNVSSTSTSKTVDVNIDLYAHGDTQVSDDSAVIVGKVTMAEINKQLGGHI